MTRSPTTKLMHETAYFLVGLIGVALLTGICFWLGVSLVATAFAYLILIVLLSLAGGFISLAALSIIAVVCLNYFFAPPIFNFHVDYEDDILTIAAFLITSLIVTGLVRTVRAARDELANILDGIPDLVWKTSPDGLADFSNRRFREYTGFSSEQLRGWGWMNALHPDNRRVEEWRAAMAAGETFEKEVVLRNTDGEYRWFVLRMMPLQNERGRILKWYSRASDIEERKRAAEALRDSEEQWRAVFEYNPSMYFMVHANGTVLAVNPFGADQLGYAVSELVGRPVLSVFYEADRPAVQRNTTICLERLGHLMRWEARKVRKDGTILWVRETAKAILMKQRTVILIICEDVTDRKQAEQALSQSEAYLAEAQRLTHTGSWAWNGTTRKTIYWSEEMFRIHGLDPQQSRPPEPDERLRFVHPEDRDRIAAHISKATQEKADFEEAYRLLFPDGTLKHLHIIGHPVLNEQRELFEYVGTVVDVTERKQAEEARLNAQIELAHANRVATIGHLTASLAHEVNQPIGAIVTNAHAALRMLKTQPPDLEETYLALDAIIKDGRRVSDVITRIRALVKKTPPEMALLSINEVIVETIALLRGEIFRTDVSLETRLATDLPPLRGDRVQLQQVILNLVMNAVEAMSSDKAFRRLQIWTGKDHEDRISVTVCDSGPPLQSDGLERFFEAFYSTKPNGMGMGLSICRSIVEAHRGRISASPNVSRGVTVNITLPVSREGP